MEITISCYGGKGVVNYIICSSAFVAMSAKCKRWIPIRSMECVHMHRRIPTIEGWGSPSCV